MKTKNIFLTAASALFMFAACSEEKIIDEPVVSAKGDLTIELAPSSVITKAAATGDGYTYATEAELNVEDCWVFVFDEKGNKVTSSYFTGADLISTDNIYTETPGPNEGTETYKKGYSVTLKNLDHGTYDFWVVANPTSDYTSCSTLSALQTIIEGGNTYKEAFTDRADKLVKVGHKEADFQSSTPIKIPVTQLAARVELSVRMSLPRQIKSGTYEYPGLSNKAGLLDIDEIDVLLGHKADRNLSINNNKIQEKDEDGKYIYTYFGHPVEITTPKQEPKYVKMDKVLEVIRKTTYEGYLLNGIYLLVDGIRIKSELSPGGSKVEQETDNNRFDPEEQSVSTTYNFKFYTYKKDKLDITLKGDLYKTTYDVSQKGTLENCIFVNDKDKVLVSKIDGGKVKDGEVLQFGGGSGWGGSTGVLLCNEDAWIAVGEVVEGQPVLQNPTPYQGGTPLVPKNGFNEGNMYDASILINSVPVNGVLEVVIEDIKEGGTIGFEFN